MSGPFDEKFTDEQRDACAVAYVDGATAKDVVQAASEGRLNYRGKTLEPFDIKASYVGSLGQRERKRRQGRAVSKVAELPHRDAIENLRMRSISAADALLAAYEKTLERKPENADPERLRQILRVQLEAARLPEPTAPRATAETRDANGNRDTRTRGGIAGALLRDHREQGTTAQDEPQHTAQDGDSSAAHHAHERSETQQRGEPGSLPSERSASQSTVPLVA